MNKDKDKILNVRMDKELYNDIKKLTGHNTSKFLRQQLKQVVDKKEAELNKFKICIACKDKHNDCIDDLLTGYPINNDNSSYNIIICKSCADKVLTYGEEDIKKSTDEILRMLWLHCGGNLDKNDWVVNRTKGCVMVFYDLCKHFPNIFSINSGGLTTNKILTEEEMLDCFHKINKIKEND
jgi:hypothetical protein|tara:strand:- start:376 stop:918 length:543 start_codon:yes stop_codon:yes gene_type:complete